MDKDYVILDIKGDYNFLFDHYAIEGHKLRNNILDTLRFTNIRLKYLDYTQFAE